MMSGSSIGMGEEGSGGRFQGCVRQASCCCKKWSTGLGLRLLWMCEIQEAVKWWTDMTRIS